MLVNVHCAPPRLKDTAVNMRVSRLSNKHWSLLFSLRENHHEKTPQMSSLGEIFSDGERASRASSRTDSWGARRVRMSMSTSGVGSSSSSCPVVHQHYHPLERSWSSTGGRFVRQWIPTISIMINISIILKILVINRWRPCAAVNLKRPRAAAIAQCTSSDKIRLGD